MRGGVLRVVLLTLGQEYLPKAWSLHGFDPSAMITEPVPGVLVETGDGFVLLDTGFNPALIRDPALHRRFHGLVSGVEARLPQGPGDPLEEELLRAGVGLESISQVAVSHLHNDHAGGLRHFAGGAPVYVQERELRYGLDRFPEAEENGIFRVDFDDPKLGFVLLKGHLDDAPEEIAPGVFALPTFGHTPGHQSFVVRFDDSVGGGGLVFAFDAGDLRENFTEEWPVGGVIGCDPEETLVQIRRLKRMAEDEGLILVPGHDPHVWPKLAGELDRAGGVLPDGYTTDLLFSG